MSAAYELEEFGGQFFLVGPDGIGTRCRKLLPVRSVQSAEEIRGLANQAHADGERNGAAAVRYDMRKALGL